MRDGRLNGNQEIQKGGSNEYMLPAGGVLGCFVRRWRQHDSVTRKRKR